MMKVFLVGFMGSGKSTFGKKLAKELKLEFIDLDVYIEEKENAPVEEIFDKKGEKHFRDLEHIYLKELSRKDQFVIATGGGTPCHNNNMDLIKSSGQSIYISMPPAALANRLIHSKKIRPLIHNKKPAALLEYIEMKLSEREKFYKMADIIADGINFNVQVIAQALEY